jgi:hypothetical protein
MQILKLLPLVFLAACFDAGNAPSCTIQCTTDSECTDGLTCGPGGLCTDGSGNCIEPDTCTANEFIACVDDMARSCNASGDGTTDTSCGAPGCNTTERRCNNCVPDAVACVAGEMLETCMPDGSATTLDPCGVPGCNTTALRCNVCVPSQVACSATMTEVESCMPDGSAKLVIDTCTAGCTPEAGTVAAHCTHLARAWLPNICDLPAATPAYTPNTSATVTTSLDTNCDAIVPQTGGSPICVVRARTITIPAGVTLTLNGTRPIAYVADTSVEVRGTLDASANTTQNGPGGRGASGTAASSSRAGGGAGFGTAGAAGGSTTPGGGGAGGAAVDPISLAAFGGGFRAPDPNGMFGMDPFGGGAGGAVMLISCRGDVKVSGTIDVNGGGGQGSYDTIAGSQIAFSGGAAGGGSGGYIVLQGMTVTVDGSLWANGGGGGGGTTTNDAGGGPGGEGLRSTSASNGGAPSGGGGTGGAGGALGVLPRVGTANTTNGGLAGGGGGAVGVLQIYTPAGVTPMTPGTVSPGFSTKRNSVLR